MEAGCRCGHRQAAHSNPNQTLASSVTKPGPNSATHQVVPAGMLSVRCAKPLLKSKMFWRLAATVCRAAGASGVGATRIRHHSTSLSQGCAAIQMDDEQQQHVQVAGTPQHRGTHPFRGHDPNQ